MSTQTITRTTVVTACDRPRCGKVISEEPESGDLADLGEKEPALVVKRTGKPDIVYTDLCDRCSGTIDNYCDNIEKKPAKKKEPEPADPGALRWVPDNEEWVCGVGEGLQAYSHEEAPDRASIVIPALEDVTDPAEAGALIAAYEEPGV